MAWWKPCISQWYKLQYSVWQVCTDWAAANASAFAILKRVQELRDRMAWNTQWCRYIFATASSAIKLQTVATAPCCGHLTAIRLHECAVAPYMQALSVVLFSRPCPSCGRGAAPCVRVWAVDVMRMPMASPMCESWVFRRLPCAHAGSQMDATVLFTCN